MEKNTMDPMKRKELKNLIHSTEAELKELKKVYRDPQQQPPKRQTYRDLDRLKFRATVCCATMAMSRGRLHSQKWTMEEQAELVLKFPFEKFVLSAA
jgi:hypothetical protein